MTLIKLCSIAIDWRTKGRALRFSLRPSKTGPGTLRKPCTNLGTAAAHAGGGTPAGGARCGAAVVSAPRPATLALSLKENRTWCLTGSTWLMLVAVDAVLATCQSGGKSSPRLQRPAPLLEQSAMSSGKRLPNGSTSSSSMPQISAVSVKPPQTHSVLFMAGRGPSPTSGPPSHITRIPGWLMPRAVGAPGSCATRDVMQLSQGLVGIDTNLPDKSAP